VGVTKGAVSTNIRALEQLRMVHKRVRPGDRKDYYQADTDFWKIAQTALRATSAWRFRKCGRGRVRGSEADLAKIYAERLAAMASFFHTIDGIVALLLRVERLRVEGLRALLPMASNAKARKRTP
jgi:hypothetical protein